MSDYKINHTLIAPGTICTFTHSIAAHWERWQDVLSKGL
jgi:hypothetical protein